MRPAPWSHTESLKEYLSKHNMPGRYDLKTNELVKGPPGTGSHGEELIEIFENEEYGGFGLRAKKRLSATESDLEVARIPGASVLNKNNIKLKQETGTNRYAEVFQIWDRPPNAGLELRLILLLEILKTHETAGYETRGSNVYVAGYMDQAFPKTVPVPTMWSQDEMKLLGGTSLEGPVAAKFNALRREFAELKHKTQNLKWAKEALWKDGNLTFDDWRLIDAWCRSRSMELPNAGTSMVPVIDLANHSSRSNVQYDVCANGDVCLKLRAGAVIEEGEELFLSYGDEKSASEMLFSYGFVEKTTLFEFLIGHIPQSVKMPAMIPNEDAKLMCWCKRFGIPMLTISGKKGNLELECPFVYFLMLEEKDGMKMKEIEGDAEIHDFRAMWQGMDITDKLDKLEILLKRNPQKEIFDIRAMFIYHALINHQMELMQEAEDFEAQFDLDELQAETQRIHKAASELRAIESTIIDSAMDIVQDWVSSEKAQELSAARSD